jgi:endonuclease YncB( thermonuclease family)
MSRTKWPALLVVVAVVSGGAGYYAHVIQTGAAPTNAAPSLVPPRQVPFYDFSRDAPCRVVRVVDGDTVDLDMEGKE